MPAPHTHGPSGKPSTAARTRRQIEALADRVEAAGFVEQAEQIRATTTGVPVTIDTLSAIRAALVAQLRVIDAEIRRLLDVPLLAEADALPERTRAALIDFDGAWHKGGLLGLSVESSYPSPNDPGYELCHRLTEHGVELRQALLRRGGA